MSSNVKQAVPFTGYISQFNNFDFAAVVAVNANLSQMQRMNSAWELFIFPCTIKKTEDSISAY